MLNLYSSPIIIAIKIYSLNIIAQKEKICAKKNKYVIIIANNGGGKMLREAVKQICNEIISEKNYLSMLDTKVGDGDHGLNMARGATAALETIDEIDEYETANARELLQSVGQAFIMNVGGAAGPLYGTGLIEAAKTLTKESKLNAETLAKFLEAAVAGIKRRGHAKKGDNALAAAKSGVEYTKTIAAKRGRASYIGERSIGYEDPGAVSTYIIFRTFCQFVKDYNLIET